MLGSDEKNVILDVQVPPVVSQQQNMDNDHDSRALELHAITAVD